MDITDKIGKIVGDEKVEEALGSSQDSFMRIAKFYAPKIAKEVGKYERVLSTKMLVNDIYKAILNVTNKGRV